MRKCIKWHAASQLCAPLHTVIFHPLFHYFRRQKYKLCYCLFLMVIGSPNGSRTRVSTVRG
jgi:hypothetical protein